MSHDCVAEGRRVAVVVPTVGRPELGRALESIRAQTYSCYEVIVVLDNPEVADEVRRQLQPSEKLLITKGGEGGAVARNLGLAAAESEFVSFLDDDDWWEPDKTRLQLSAMLGRDATFSSTYSIFHSRGGQRRLIPRTTLADQSRVADYLVSRAHLTHGDGFIQTSSFLLDRELALAVGWDTSMRKHQDWDFVVRAINENGARYQCCEHPLVNVVQGTPGSVSKRVDSAASLEWFDRHVASMGRVGAGDFLFTQVGRSVLISLEYSSFKEFARRAIKTRPHVAAWIVMLSGLATGAKMRIDISRRRFQKKDLVAE